ncbi:hypothetical protein [Floridanema aerugineum]|uniref:Uncharacterized protein n=1 Tax=Floridaenema aerugineum BLCC-F46 TaxID=3153654 RepID=A0ABV4X872_9CYAN
MFYLLINRVYYDSKIDQFYQNHELRTNTKYDIKYGGMVRYTGVNAPYE